MLKKCIYKFIIIFSLIIFPLTTNAWNYTGHVIIAQIAYDNLTPPVKQKADILANIIYDHLYPTQQNMLDKYYGSASTFAKIAELPDVWRNDNLLQIFLTNGALPPLHLLMYSLVPSKGLHFLNLPYPQSSRCQDFEPFNVVWGINQFENVFKSTNSQNSRAVLMVLEEHYIGDIHQPLHTISRFNGMCVDDEGGNDFCLKYNNYNGRCSKSLHQLWDTGVGFIKEYSDIQSTAEQLQQQFPANQFINDLKDNNPQDWATANYAYADFIYGLREGQRPSANYYRQGQLIAEKQMVLAGYRLAKVLNAEM